MTALALLLSGLIGLSLGLLGGGGSILAVPILVYIAGVPAQEAVGMSLAVVGATSLFAGLLHFRTGNVDLRLAVVFSLVGTFGSYLGARLTRGVRPELLLLLFALAMLTAGGLMIRRRSQRVPPGRRQPKPLGVVPVAFGVGLLNGFLGVGGGFLIVPALVLFGRLPMGLAVGTSLFVIAANSGAGFLGHLGGPRLDLPLTAAFTGMALAGAVAGQRLAGGVPSGSLRLAFGLFVILIGATILILNIAALL